MAEMPVSNPERILHKLDSYLERETRIVLFGRAALALGFGKHGSQFGKTMDVDAILPSVEMGKIEADAQFWRAIELTNRSLLPDGLYVSHLFTDKQVALTPDWLDKIVEIEAGEFKYLRMFRPSAGDTHENDAERSARYRRHTVHLIPGKSGSSRVRKGIRISKAFGNRRVAGDFHNDETARTRIGGFIEEHWGCSPESCS